MNNLKPLSKKKIIFIIILIAATFLIFMIVKENIRHHRLAQSMDLLTQELRSKGLSATQSSGCGSGQGVYGPTGRSCSMSITARNYVADIHAADEVLQKFKKVLENNLAFSEKTQLPKSFDKDRGGASFGHGFVQHDVTRSNCGVPYDYNYRESFARLSITCDDSSWFTRTFQFN